jgi:site-specific recombinase XerD
VSRSSAFTPHPAAPRIAIEARTEHRERQATELHGLRHSCASSLLASEASPRVVMEILGHSGMRSE